MPRTRSSKKPGCFTQLKPALVFTDSPPEELPRSLCSPLSAAENPVTANVMHVGDGLESTWVSPQFHRNMLDCEDSPKRRRRRKERKTDSGRCAMATQNTTRIRAPVPRAASLMTASSKEARLSGRFQPLLFVGEKDVGGRRRGGPKVAVVDEQMEGTADEGVVPEDIVPSASRESTSRRRETDGQRWLHPFGQCFDNSSSHDTTERVCTEFPASSDAQHAVCNSSSHDTTERVCTDFPASSDAQQANCPSAVSGSRPGPNLLMTWSDDDHSALQACGRDSSDGECGKENAGRREEGESNDESSQQSPKFYRNTRSNARQKQNLCGVSNPTGQSLKRVKSGSLVVGDHRLLGELQARRGSSASNYLERINVLAADTPVSDYGLKVALRRRRHLLPKAAVDKLVLDS